MLGKSSTDLGKGQCAAGQCAAGQCPGNGMCGERAEGRLWRLGKMGAGPGVSISPTLPLFLLIPFDRHETPRRGAVLVVP